jgi:hypothetical protein
MGYLFNFKVLISEVGLINNETEGVQWAFLNANSDK